MCRLLPGVGYSPTILTLDNPVNDLSEMVDYEVEVIRAKSLNINKWINTHLHEKRIFSQIKEKSTTKKTILTMNERKNGFYKSLSLVYKSYFEFPDNANTWILPAIRKALLLASETAFQAIYSTSPRISSHFCALYLSKKLNIPWIMEFRDLWVDNPWHEQYHLKIRKLLESYFERKLIEKASAVVTVSTGSAKMLAQRYKHLNPNVVVIPNGFEPSEYSIEAKEPNTAALEILHTGSFYNGRRDISGFLDAIKLLIDTKKIRESEICLYVAGDTSKYATKLAVKLGVGYAVKDLGRLSLEQTLYLQSSSHLLLLVEASEDSEWVHANIPGKIYEYFGAKRPIMALINPESLLAEMIRESNAGVVYSPFDVLQIATYLETQIKKIRRDDCLHYNPNTDYIDSYSWSNLVKKVGHVLDQTINYPAG